MKGNKIVRPSVRALGPLRKKWIDLAYFDSIEIDIPINVYWSVARKHSMILQTPESFIKHLFIEISGQKLTISSKSELVGGVINCYLTGVSLSEVHASSEAQIQVEQLVTSTLVCTLRQSAYLSLQGVCDEAHFELSDASILDALSLNAPLCVCEVHDKAHAFVRPTLAFQGSLESSGYVFSLGHAQNINDVKIIPGQTDPTSTQPPPAEPPQVTT